MLRSFGRFPDLHLYPFSRSQDFTLQIEASTFRWVIFIKQCLESLHHAIHVGLAALWGLDVENLAGFIECKTR